MTSNLRGNMTMVTMGWADRGPIYIFSILPLGIVTLVTMTAALYGLVQSWNECHDAGKRTPFDVPNTLHLIMASAEGGLASKLSGFYEKGLNDNESIPVKLTELKNHRKKLDSEEGS
ncbi:hypothetical protein PAXINDRAFT_14847 [Paxillus involutus ATCC 200175]|uniref:Uncharacterized protein n=1 Tax=Paxillus involutus ATCC 200175 TaxID=664439 RepID=A0A0C9TP92_PAXIN|nr:hypothetical protein PAXINDRAFT_14847 [Paxillus involutus ATCC 200175]